MFAESALLCVVLCSACGPSPAVVPLVMLVLSAQTYGQETWKYVNETVDDYDKIAWCVASRQRTDCVPCRAERAPCACRPPPRDA